MMPMYNNWWCGPGAFFPGPFGLIITLLFWAAIIFLGVKLFQAVFRSKPQAAPSSLEILKRRYAKGEIDQQDYERMKKKCFDL